MGTRVNPDQPTICWGCKNTNRFDCPWFNPDDPQPVPGWVAEPREMYSGATTYLVKECPKFEPMPPRKAPPPPPPGVGIQGVSRKRKKEGIRWEARIMRENKNYYLGTFKTAEEANEARLAAEAAIARGEEPQGKNPTPGGRRAKRKYPGVYFEHGSWRAIISHNGWRYHLGCFKTEEEAITARKAAEEAIKRGEEPKQEKPKQEKPKQEKPLPSPYPPGCYPGVRRRSRYWVAYIKHQGKQYHLGYFQTEEKAIAAKKAAVEAIKRGEIPAH